MLISFFFWYYVMYAYKMHSTQNWMSGDICKALDALTAFFSLTTLGSINNKSTLRKTRIFSLQNCPLGSHQFSISIHDQILSYVPKCIIDLNHDFFPSLSLCVPSSLDISSFLDFSRENLIKDKEGILQRFLLLKAP